jgi:hypothetical protein
MRSLLRSQALTAYAAALLAAVLAIGATATVDAKRPPKPPPTPTPSPTAPPPTGSVTIEIAPSGILEPNRQYANVNVTVTCPTGWTWVRGGLTIRQSEPGGSGSFSASCTGTAQVVPSRVVNGNKWTLGNATALAFATIARNGQEVQGSSQRSIKLDPGVVVRVADQGQLIDVAGAGSRLAVAVACPSGAAGQSSSISVSQGGAQGSASFTPICDGTSRTLVVSITASQGSFQTGGATGAATASVGFNSQSFQGADSRAITILESSVGDTTPPTMPAMLSANVFGDGETWLDWNASSDNATPSGLIVYEVYLNGRFDQPIGGGYTDAILYADLGVVSTIEVIAVDGAGNKSAPATVTVDCTQGWCQ